MQDKNAIVLLANYYQFSNHEKVVNSDVKSRMLLWCKAGRGWITINSEKHEALPGKVFFLPWAHSIAYQAANEDPFLVAGVHIVPDHDRKKPVRFEIPHNNNASLAASPSRKDVRLEGLEGVLCATWTAETPLSRLAEYTVALFRRALPDEAQARLLGQLLIQEMHLFFSKQQQTVSAVSPPAELRQMLQFIETHLHEPLSLKDLVGFSGCSASTICRLFGRYCHATPVNTIIKMKIEKARKLLLESKISVAKTGEAIGIDDPYYFSKVFKKQAGKSPREYRKAVSLL